MSIPGKGSFVAQANLELVREENLKQIESRMQECIALAAQSGLSLNDLCEILTILYKGE